VKKGIKCYILHDAGNDKLSDQTPRDYCSNIGYHMLAPTLQTEAEAMTDILTKLVILPKVKQQMYFFNQKTTSVT
jgi:hypothetical protein